MTFNQKYFTVLGCFEVLSARGAYSTVDDVDEEIFLTSPIPMIISTNNNFQRTPKYISFMSINSKYFFSGTDKNMSYSFMNYKCQMQAKKKTLSITSVLFSQPVRSLPLENEDDG